MATRGQFLVKKETTSVKKPIKVAPREFFRLKFFRFKCRDANKTIEFYKSCGMTLDFDGDLESFKPLNIVSPQRATAGKTMESNHVKKLAANLRDEEKLAEDKASQGGVCGRVFGLSYASSTGVIVPNRIQLIFEEDVQFINEELSRNADGRQENTETTDKKVDPKLDVSRKYEYLVIYVHFLSRLIKRMASKGYEVMMDVTHFENVKMAILRDPNQIQIRFMELLDPTMNESNKKQWFARLGYYTIPTSNADSTVTTYESMFQIRVPKANAKKDKDAKEKEDQNLQPVNVRKIGPSQTVKNALSKGSGFRIVDMDELVVGLKETVFYWLGNDMRTGACCVCFTEVSNADTTFAFTSYIAAESPLLSIGFEVPNLDIVVNRLKHETKDSLTWDPFRYKMAKAGIYARFQDKINGLALDLLCTKLDNATPAGKGDDKRKPKTTTLQKEPVVILVKEEVVYYIDLNHLKGHSRSLSEGAIKRTKSSNHEIKGPIVVEEPNKKEKEKKVVTSLREENGSATESTFNLDRSYGDVSSKKAHHPKNKEDMRAHENMMNREKSKSV